MKRPVRIGNVSGLYGDRPSALREMLDGGSIDILTGDWLAELTMLILARTRTRHPDGGFGRTFVTQMDESLGDIVERGIKVVVNAGGLDPIGCANAVRAVAAKLGLDASVAAITGDDLSGRLRELMAEGEAFANLDTGDRLGDMVDEVITANAYLGGWGIVEALNRGADIVVTGRVTDAALVVGAAAWWHKWERTNWDALAGAVVAGHVIECSMQATGGNYSLFTAVSGMERPGFPWVEVAGDGSCVVGKHEGTGGEVSVGTITSQLLYEIDGPEYLNADVTARFDSIEIAQISIDRVGLTGIRGQPPPQRLKVGVARPGGFRNSMMVGITGLDPEAKAETFVGQFWVQSPWPPEDYEEVRTSLIGRGELDPSSNTAAISYLEIAVRDPDEEKVGRRWADSMVHVALGSFPGLFGVWPPRSAAPYAVFWPTTVDRRHVAQHIHLEEEEFVVEETDPGVGFVVDIEALGVGEPPTGETVNAPFAALVGARSGDKGGNANLGLFTWSESAYPWLVSFLTVGRLRELLPELGGLEIDRYEFPRLSALNFVIHGILDAGVSSTLRVDPQAKGLGEYLRAKHVDVPRVLIGEET